MSPKKKKMANYLDLSNKSSVAGQGRLPKFRGEIDSVSTLAADTTLYDYNSGSVYFLNGASAFDVTLPAVKAGLSFKFIIVDVTADVDIVQADSAHDFVGTIIDGAGSSDTAANSDTKIIFDQSGGSAAGDWVCLHCDGSKWYVSGGCDAAGGVVFG